MSAETKVAALNDLTRLAQQFRGILGLADELKDFVSFESAKDAELKKLADAKEVYAAMQAKLAAMDHDIEEAQHELDSHHAELEHQRVLAADETTQAHMTAQSIVQAARVSAVAIEHDAKIHADAVTAAHTNLVKENAELEKRVVENKHELSGLTARVAEMQAKHDRLSHGLAALKTSF